MKTRMLFVRKGCFFCRQMVKVINKINLKMEIEDRIQIIDAWEYEEFDLRNLPLIEKLRKDGIEEGYPLLIIDSIRIEPAPTEEILNTLLTTMLSEDLIYN